jgi:lysine-specific demethylase 3
MDDLPDSQHDKRTSISQLLNPVGLVSSHEQPSFPHHSTLAGAIDQPHEQQGGHPFQHPYAHVPPFNLRAASWGLQENALKRKPDGGVSLCTTHQPRRLTSRPIGDHGPNPMRPRIDPSPNYMDGGVWPAAHEIAAVPYGAPVISPMYSDERTGEHGLTLIMFVITFIDILLSQLYRVTIRRTVSLLRRLSDLI